MLGLGQDDVFVLDSPYVYGLLLPRFRLALMRKGGRLTFS